MSKKTLKNDIYTALKAMQILPSIFGKDKADQYYELANTLIETNLTRTIDNGDGTFTVYLAFSERGKYGEGNIAIYKLVQSKNYNPFIEGNNTLVFTQLLPFIPRRVASHDFENGSITFFDENNQEITYSCYDEGFVNTNNQNKKK